MINRKIIVDTETTGMNSTGCFYKNHKIIEIGAVEMINNNFTGNNFHSYIQPNRPIDKKAFQIHGISDVQLLNKPIFKDIYLKFLKYIKNSVLIVHNSKFDISFIDYELSLLNSKSQKISNLCKVIDTLAMARKLFPGKKNSLSALCNRYKIDLTNRKTHSAILDAELLGKVYIFMMNSQSSLLCYDNKITNNIIANNKNNLYSLCKTNMFKVLLPTKEEINRHNKLLSYMKKKFGQCLWTHENNE